MKVRVVLALLLFTGAYAAPLSSPQLRFTPSEVDSMQAHDSGAGTSGVAGIRTTVVAGDPTKVGPYTIRLSIPANTKIQAHTHRDNRTPSWYRASGTSVTVRWPPKRKRKLFQPEVSTPNLAESLISRKPGRIPYSFTLPETVRPTRSTYEKVGIYVFKGLSWGYPEDLYAKMPCFLEAYVAAMG